MSQVMEFHSDLLSQGGHQLEGIKEEAWKSFGKENQVTRLTLYHSKDQI